MVDEPAGLSIGPMLVGDIAQVKVIEAASFATGWPEAIYRREIESNTNAVYIVATIGARRQVVGYAGLWMQYDEGHVSTLAVDPAFRRRGIAEALLVQLIDEAIRRGAGVVTLEVRKSNAAAQSLYSGYGFREAGRRPRYYSDTGEDAIIMTTPDLDDSAWLAGYRVRRMTVLRKVSRLEKEHPEGDDHGEKPGG